MKNMSIEEIGELFSRYGMTVTGIDIGEEENIANVHIEVSSVLIYSIDTIDAIVKKIKDLRSTFVEQDAIEDITFGDLYQGIWRIIIHFNED